MAKEILSALEAASESVVMAEPSDLQSLVELHTRLEEVVAACGEEESSAAKWAAQAAGVLVESIILNDCGDPAAAMEAVGETIECMQYIVRDGRAESEVTFPKRLGPRFDSSEAVRLEEAPADAPAPEPAPAAAVLPPEPSEVMETPLQGDLGVLGEFVLEAREHLENA
ncbi:MAG: hypothetical protein RBU21_16380, partial [FCB group bacterium]|nr:hypothetical protein [FCB group bacterium]